MIRRVIANLHSHKRGIEVVTIDDGTLDPWNIERQTIYLVPSMQEVTSQKALPSRQRPITISYLRHVPPGQWPYEGVESDPNWSIVKRQVQRYALH